MCTVSWLSDADGYQLFFNRDERRSRQPGRRPQMHVRHGVECVYPLDPEGGGTWVGVNAHGLAFALLNYYPAGAPERRTGRQSRGQIILGILHLKQTDDAFARIEAADLGVYPPFMLVGVQPGDQLRGLFWDGRDLVRRTIDRPPALSTSSYRTEEVVASRMAVYESVLEAAGEGLSPVVLSAFHRSHLPERGPYSVCMHREDAQTVSHAHIQVTAEDVRLSYCDGPPCENPLQAAVTISRTGGS